MRAAAGVGMLATTLAPVAAANGGGSKVVAVHTALAAAAVGLTSCCVSTGSAASASRATSNKLWGAAPLAGSLQGITSGGLAYCIGGDVSGRGSARTLRPLSQQRHPPEHRKHPVKHMPACNA
jgi:hypothetical protein